MRMQNSPKNRRGGVLGSAGTSRKRCLATLTTSVNWDEILRSSVRMMLYCTICGTRDEDSGPNCLLLDGTLSTANLRG
jgi:hypothetical protein